jgi:hypothetical protein
MVNEVAGLQRKIVTALTSMNTHHITKISSRIFLGFLATTSIGLAVTALPASAQVRNSELFSSPQSGDSGSDPFSTRGSGQLEGAFDLLHQFQQSPSRTVYEFQADQQEEIDTAASDFLRQRQLLLQQETTPSPQSNNLTITPEQ